MRQLHVVALSADGRSLLLASAPKGARASYRVAVDGRLKTALAGERPKAPEEPAPRTDSALSVREIQARLRAGHSLAEVARAAGVSPDRVEPYLAPVEAERIQVIDDAQSAVMERPRRGESARPLGSSVAVNLAPSAGVEMDTVQWTARRRVDGRWIVRLEYVARSRRRSAQWEWDPRTHELLPLDNAATSLGYVDPSGRARRAPAAPSQKKTPRKAATRKATARKSTARKTTARKAAPRKATARKTTARKTTARKAAPRKATTRKTTARKSTARKATTRKTTRRR